MLLEQCNNMKMLRNSYYNFCDVTIVNTRVARKYVFGTPLYNYRHNTSQPLELVSNSTKAL